MSITWIVLIILAVLILLFIYNGFRTRCPYCGDYSLHPKDKQAEEEQKKSYELLQETGLGNKLDEYGSEFGSSMNKPGYSNSLFKCKSCGHTFSRKTALIWLNIANKLGEETAIREYRKLQTESNSDFTDVFDS